VIDNSKYLEAKEYWKVQFNGQDKQVRHLNCASSISTQINELELEKKRTKKAYDFHCMAISEKIVFLKSELINFKRMV